MGRLAVEYLTRAYTRLGIAGPLIGTVMVALLPNLGAGADARAVFKKASPAVVRVEAARSVGSGFVVYGGKLVVTCHHVIEDSVSRPWEIWVNGMPCDAVLAADEELDIAVLKVLTPVKASLTLRQETAELGERAYCIGFPLGLREMAISEGIVSSKRRTTQARYVQTSAAISEGSSGSPLLDERGAVIGLVQSTLKEGQQNNIALSIESARPVIDAGIKALGGIAKGKAVQGSHRVVVGKLGQAIKATAIVSKPGGRVYYRVKPYEYLVLRSSDKPNHYKVLLQNGSDGYVPSDAVRKLPVDVTAPTSQGPETEETDGRGKADRPKTASAGAVGKRIAEQALALTGFDFNTLEAKKAAQQGRFGQYVCEQAGVLIPLDIKQASQIGTEVARLEDLEAGDRLYFHSKAKASIDEVGIYLGNGYFTRLDSKGIVKTDYLGTEFWLKKLVCARRSLRLR